MSCTDLKKTISVYMTIDPLFRIHSRLYKIHQFNVKKSKMSLVISKANLSFYGLAFAGFVGLITYSVQVLGLSVTSTSVYIPVLIAIYPAYLYIRSIAGVVSSERQIKKMLKELPDEKLENWIEYNLDLIAAHGTRLKLVEEIIKAADNLLETDPNDIKSKNIVESYKVIKTYLLRKLDEIRNKNDELRNSQARSEKDYERIKLYLENAFRGISR